MKQSQPPEESPTVGPAVYPEATDGLSVVWVPDSLDDLEPADPWFAGPPEDPDRYELLGSALAGGEGQLWKARYRGSLPEPLSVAVKLLRPPMHAPSGWPTAADRRRWQDQAALLRHLDLDHVVKVHEVFFGAWPHAKGAGPVGARAETAAYIVMEWVDGDTLSAALRGTPATAETLPHRLGHARDVAHATATLHSRSRSAGNPTLHRDIKPSNCIVHPDRGVVLVDTSSMRLLSDGADPAGMHTPAYTSPEVKDAPLAPRSPSCDVYALGALAAFCLLGEDPPELHGDGVERTILRQALMDVGRAADIPRPDQVTELILTAMHADPDRRPLDTVAWVDHLFDAAGLPLTRHDVTASESNRGSVSRRRRVLRRMGGAVVAAAVVITVAAVVRWSGDGEPAPAASPAPTPIRAAATGADLPPVASRPGFSAEIGSPADGAQVKQCSVLTGTSSLPEGMTLILAMRNLDNGDPMAYVEFPAHWDAPSRLGTWRGVQYFGSGDSSAGQAYAVDLVAVALDVVRRADEADDAGEAVNDLALSGTVLDRIVVERVPGGVATDCRKT